MIYLGIACFSVLFAKVTGQIKGWLGIEIRLKPFDCEYCLAFILGAVHFFLEGQATAEALLNASIASILALLIWKLVNRL